MGREDDCWYEVMSEVVLVGLESFFSYSFPYHISLLWGVRLPYYVTQCKAFSVGSSGALVSLFL